MLGRILPAVNRFEAEYTTNARIDVLPRSNPGSTVFEVDPFHGRMNNESR
jgi:hypothetical protein